MVESGLGRSVSRPPESKHGNESLGIKGPATFDVKDYGDPHSPEYNSLKYMGGKNVGTEPIRHVYRGVSEDEFKNIQETGQIKSDMRGAISGLEGTNAAADPRDAVSYLPHGGSGRVLKIAVQPEDKWFTIRADQYLRTTSAVPASRIVAMSPVITKEPKYGQMSLG
jgi:hypothetical protein